MTISTIVVSNLSDSLCLIEGPRTENLSQTSEKEPIRYKLVSDKTNLKKMTMEVDLENGTIIEVTIEIFKLNGTA